MNIKQRIIAKIQASKIEEIPLPSMDFMNDFDKEINYESLKKMVELVRMCQPEQVNLGADSGKNGLPEPSKEAVLELIDELGKFTKVKIKKNLIRIIK